MSHNDDILTYLPLVRWVCRKCGKTAVPEDDLVQEGLLGVLDAQKRYQPARGTKFETYAVYWIRKRVLEAMEREREQAPQESVPLECVPPEQMVWHDEVEDGWFESIIQGGGGKLSETETGILRLLYGESRTVEEVAKELGLSRARVVALKQRALKVLRNEGKGSRPSSQVYTSKTGRLHNRGILHGSGAGEEQGCQ